MREQFLSIRWVLLMWVLFGCGTVQAQSAMQKGFDFLEQGELAQAEEFFKEYLLTTPEDRTANICYARAIGLQGKTDAAEDIFIRLDRKYPKDYEIGLNLAECYMWKKETDNALNKYNELLQSDPNNYVANLGYANALSSKKSYALSKKYIDKATSIDPKNQGARNSKKYIYMGYADSLRTNEEYEESGEMFRYLDKEYPNDRDIRVNLAVLNLMDNKPSQARKYYKSLIKDDIDSIEGNLGLSYTSILLNRKKDALDYAMQAESLGKNTDNQDLALRIGIAKIDALAFNKRWDDNAKELIKLQKRFGNIKEVQLANVRRNVWRGNFEKGRKAYVEMRTVDPDDFRVILGLSEVKNAQGFSHQALEYAQEAKKLSPGNLDIVSSIKNIESSRKAYALFNVFSSSDNGDNETSLVDGKLFAGMYRNFRPYINLSYRRANSPILEKTSFLNQVVFGAEQTLTRFLKWNGYAGWSFASPNPESEVSNAIGQMKLTVRLNQNNTTDLFYKREMHSYSVDLIANNIAMNHYGLNYNFSSDSGLGFYGQYMLTQQSDSNFRNLLFSSLYYALRDSPSIKVGMNYSQMGYDFNRGELYFSPDIYRSGEGFVEILNLYDARAKILYHLNMVFGLQKIEQQNNQSTQRLELELGYRFSKRFYLLGYYNFSNAAQSTVSGFTFNRIGLKSRIGF